MVPASRIPLQHRREVEAGTAAASLLQKGFSFSSDLDDSILDSLAVAWQGASGRLRLL